MGTKTLQLNIISARDLQDVNLLSKMDVYAVATLLGDPRSKQKAKTSVDREGGRNPSWNFPMRFTIDSHAAKQGRLILEVKLRCARALGDKDIGEVNIPVNELLDSDSGNGQSLQYVSYQVRKPSGRPKGELNISYKLGDQVTAPAAAAPPPKAEPVAAYPSASFAVPPPKVEHPAAAYPSAPFAVPQPLKAEPVVAYPAQGVGCSSAPSAPPYHAPPPPPPGYPYQATSSGYAYPPPPPSTQGYGAYPPPRPGYGYSAAPAYGYPQVQQPPKKNNKLGLGLGAGLLGGALGGLLLGDMVSDVASYDAGYDAGFGDGGGFGF